MIIPVGYAQVNFRFTSPDLPFGAEFTIGTKWPDGIIPVDGAGHWSGAWGACGIMDLLDNDLTMAGVRVKLGPNATGPSAEIATSFTGNGGSQGATPNVALLIRKETSLGGHAGRGRFFVPGLPLTSFTNDGHVVSAARASMQDAMDEFYDQTAADDWVPVVLHNPGSPITTPTPITRYGVDDRVATQRRRLRR
jgi:hypothetical protein